MSAVPEHFRLTLKPIAAQQAIVQFKNVRFTILTDRLIRLEHQAEAHFEDRPTQLMWYREQPVPHFTVTADENSLEIETDTLHLRYSYEQDGLFTPTTLSIRVKAVDTTWQPGDVDAQNLKGTTRTLDFVNGYTPLTEGLMSRSGWSLVDDSASFVLNAEGWIEPRGRHTVDWYFFGYGQDYKACLQDYCNVSGAMPMIPRWILGNWWSRYWAYTQDELKGLINDFTAHEIPLSVCIVDMDWHVTKTNNDSTGWTGYTWNRDLFPNPEGLIDFFHQKGLKTGLNLHPAEGIHNHEAAYPEMARHMGIDPASGTPIAFDITDPHFVKGYFEFLHHPYEKMGVDFWWVDWQQGQTCRIEGLDPLWMINHLHFHDLGRNPDRRPFIFSRWGEQGHQRYPIGFSGDSYMTWDTLRYETYMTPTASNIAYGWWSHDIGGHTSGDGDSELFTRWVQFGVLSPIMRIHTTKGAYYDQRPWGFNDAEVLNVLRDTMQFRHQLVPYLYTMAARAHRDCLPLMLPMYYDYPHDEAAYASPQQYLFGSELIAAPFVEAADETTKLARQVVWLPKGEWYHFFTGERFTGDSWHAVYGALKDIPLFAKSGAIIPLAPPSGQHGEIHNPSALHLHIFSGADGTFTLYEDDGESRGYLRGAFCETTFSQTWADEHLTFEIGAAQGDTTLIPAERTYNLYFHGVKADATLTLSSQSAYTHDYDESSETLCVSAITLNTAQPLTITLQAAQDNLRATGEKRQREKLLAMIRAFKLNNGVRNRLVEQLDAILAQPEQIAPYLIAMSPAQQRAIFETLYEAGIHHIADTHHPTQLILWNNRADQAITYRYGDAFLFFGMVKSAHHQQGIVPRFAALTPKIETWRHGANDEHTQQTQWSLQVDYHNLVSVKEEHLENSP